MIGRHPPRYFTEAGNLGCPPCYFGCYLACVLVPSEVGVKYNTKIFIGNDGGDNLHGDCAILVGTLEG